jgi:hypothetical protein
MATNKQQQTKEPLSLRKDFYFTSKALNHRRPIQLIECPSLEGGQERFSKRARRITPRLPRNLGPIAPSIRSITRPMS